MHWASQYIGKPWVSGGRGPVDFDCWGLLRWICWKEFLRPLLPLYPIPATDSPNVSVAMESAIAGPDWQRLAKPAHGCAVGLGMGRRLHHCGLYIADDGGQIVHCQAGKGTVAQTVSAFRAEGWGRIEFYWHKSWPQNPPT